MRSAAEEISWMVESRCGEVAGRLAPSSNPSEGLLCGGVGRLPLPLRVGVSFVCSSRCVARPLGGRVGERSRGLMGALKGEKTSDPEGPAPRK